MAQQEIRTYEISVWTLQDDYITVLKPAHTENKGQVQEAKMRLNIDGTQELQFKIPIYIYENGERIENPIWYNTKEGVFVENLRKVKVIFNKATTDEAVFEFIITKVVDEHVKDELYCNVECEGLAFNELGKIGYKISLSSEKFNQEYENWFHSEDASELNWDDEPVANINYWLNQFMTPVPNGYINPAEWHYEIAMDWSSYDANLSSSKIYDEAYVGSWNTTTNGTSIIGLTPGEVVEMREKWRLIDIEESNIYNITQQLAETFNVFCRYEYTHDASYHISGRKVVFYNHFFYENDGYIDLTYPYSTDSIHREINSSDLVTKMFVKPVESVNSESNLVTIMDVPANRSKEDYVMNFDYFHDINTISDEQYAEIDVYEGKMRDLNTQLVVIEKQILDVQNKITPLEAEKTIAQNAIQLDQERLSNAKAFYDEITKNVDNENPDGYVEITVNHPDTAVLLEDKDSTAETNSYYIKMSHQGIDPGSVHIYNNYQAVQAVRNGEEIITPGYTYFPDGSEVLTGQFVYDDFGDLIKITNLYKPENSTSSIRYLTYRYSPKLYYDKVIETWTNRLAKDEATLADVEPKLELYTTQLTSYQAAQNSLLTQKQNIIKSFERMMGPALREGYWLPDDFNDYGDHYADWWENLTNINENKIVENSVPESTEMDYFLWDTEPFYDEQLAYYLVGVTAEKQNYPCVLLPDNILTDNAATNAERLSRLCYMFYDYIKTNENPYTHGKLHCYALGSGCALGFAYYNEEIKPVLILTGTESLPSSQALIYKNQARIGSLTVDTSHVPKIIKVTDWTWPRENSQGTLQNSLTFLDNVQLVYPRIVIKSMSLKTAEDQLIIGYNQYPLKQYEDYYITSRILNDDNLTPSYFITPKPEALLRQGGLTKSLSINYAISNADISIYLDALKILKENAYPKVSYSIDTNIVDTRYMRQAYNLLSHLVRINDLDLKFKNVRGYISEANLSLDKPWEDEYEIKNYRNKFEDLFSSIVAQTAEMKKSSGIIDMAGSLVTTNGEIDPNLFQNSLRKVDLNYAFNHGKLTIDEKNGIWGMSEAGVVAFRGGGIFTATTKDRAGNWIWNTGIIPQGINADLITTGQLDTNRIMIYAGDKLRFQFNGEGLFAYKSFMEDISGELVTTLTAPIVTEVNRRLAEGQDVDSSQYIKFDSNGIFFNLKKGALVLNEERTNYIKIGDYYYTYERRGDENGKPYYIVNTSDDPALLVTIPDEFARVSLTWDGLTLRNYNGEPVFYLSANTGDIFMKGNLFAADLHIVNNNGDLILFDDYIDSSTEDIVQGIIDDVQGHLLDISNKVDMLNEDFTDSLNYANDLLDGVQGNLVEIDNKVDLLNADFNESLDVANEALTQVQVNLVNVGDKITGLNDDFSNSLQAITALLRQQPELISTSHKSVDRPTSYKIGDRWTKLANQSDTTGIEYIATSTDHIEDTNGTPYYEADWVQVGRLDYAGITINDPLGYIKIGAGNKIQLTAGSQNSDEGAIEMVTTSGTAVNVFTLNHEGIKLGSGKKITLFSNEGVSTTGAAVELSKDRILFGVSNNSNGTAVDIDSTGFVVTNGTVFTSNNGKTVDTFSPFVSGGLRIKKDSIGMTASNSLFWMDNEGLELGTLSNTYTGNSDPNKTTRQNDLLRGTYVFIKHTITEQGVEIGTSDTDENNNALPSLVSVRPKQVLIATSLAAPESGSNRYQISAIDLQATKLIYVNGYALNTVAAAKNFSNGGVAYQTDEFNPRTSKLSGFRITNTDLGLSITTQESDSGNVTYKTLFWMDSEGIELGSVSNTSGTAQHSNLLSGSYIFIKHEDGVEVGTDKNNTPSIFSVRPGRVLIATRDTTNGTSAVDVQSGKIIITAGNNVVSSSDDVTAAKDFTDAGIASAIKNFNPLTTDKSGVRVTKNDIGMAVIANTNLKNLIWMDQNGVEIGSVELEVTSSHDYTSPTSGLAAINKNAGGYVLIRHADGVEIGSGTSTNASIIQLKNNGVIHAVTGTRSTGTNANYAAFNLGYGDYSYGFEAETTGALSIQKRISNSASYPLQIRSEGITNTQLILRRWTTAPNAATSDSAVKLTLQTNENNSMVIAINNNINTKFSVDENGVLSASYHHAVNGNDNSRSYGEIMDTIKAYTRNSDGSIETIILSDGTVLTFKRPASGISLNDVIPSISVSGASANLILSATGQTDRTISTVGTLKLSSGTESPDSYIYFDTGSYAQTANNYPAIGLADYWYSAKQNLIDETGVFTAIYDGAINTSNGWMLRTASSYFGSDNEWYTNASGKNMYKYDLGTFGKYIVIFNRNPYLTSDTYGTIACGKYDGDWAGVSNWTVLDHSYAVMNTRYLYVNQINSIWSASFVRIYKVS